VKIIRTVQCCIVYHSCTTQTHMKFLQVLKLLRTASDSGLVKGFLCVSVYFTYLQPVC